MQKRSCFIGYVSSERRKDILKGKKRGIENERKSRWIQEEQVKTQMEKRKNKKGGLQLADVGKKMQERNRTESKVKRNVEA